MKKRTKGVLAAALAAAGVFLLAGLDARLLVRAYTVESGRLTGPVRLAVLTDLHACAYGEGQRELLDAVAEQSPDLVLLCGDIVDDEPRMPEERALDTVEALAAVWPTYYVTGNHEFWTGRVDEVKARLEERGAVVLAVNAAALPGALESIVMGAVAPKAALGGALGYGVAAAMRFGVARGVFTNEAGMGSSAMAHAASDVKEPAEQGMWGVFEVFVATLVVCSITALVILTTGVYDPAAALAAIEGGAVTNAMLGAPLSAAAFGTVFGRWGGVFVSVCLLLFAFTSLLGWSYYGERGLSYLTGTTRWKWLYRVFFMVMVVLGSVGDMSSMWQLADIFNGLMALPNLAALFLLRREVAVEK